MAKSKTLKIGFVFDDSLDRPDGVQQYILSLGEWLSQQGHEVHYLVGKTSRSDIANVHSLSRNVAVRFNGNGLSIPLPASRRGIRQFLVTQQYDVLHVQVPYSPLLGGRIIAAAGPHAAVVGTFHIAAYSRLVSVATKLLGLYTAPTTRRFDEVVSVSRAAQSFAKQTFDLQTKVVPNAIDYARFSGAARPLTKKPLTITFLGRLVPRKGCRVLLEAVNQLAQDQSLPDFKVVIGGRGPQLAELERYVSEHGLTKKVAFRGFISEDDKPAFLAAADISVFPSSGGESFGIVLVEAMASGRSCVLGGDNSGYHTVLEPQPSLLFDPRDAAALATKIATFMKNPGQRQQMADWGKHYAAQFDQSLVGAAILQTYERALQKRTITEIM